MKKRAFSIFLVLALLLAALAGCGQDNNGSSKAGDDDEEVEQLLTKGYYAVYDEDEDLAGYLHVTSSKITVYDKRGREDETLRYDYSEKKDLYTIEDGELFGSEEFTVEKSKKKLKLITEDDEYTLEEIDEDEIGGGGSKPAGNDEPVEPDSDYIELPLGCYAVYDGRSLTGYMKVMGSTMIAYEDDGYYDGETGYSYNRDGTCVLKENGTTLTVGFTYERGEYYMYALDYDNQFVRLEPVSESEIPDPEDTPYTPPSVAGYYIGGNGSIGLYAWLPDELYDALNIETADDSLAAVAQLYDYNIGAALIFSAVLSSGDNLEDAVEAAWADVGGAPYGSDSQMLFAYLRDNMVGSLDSGYFSGVYLGDDLDYAIDEDYMTVNGRTWRYCDLYISADDGEAYVSMMFWMDGDDMALVIIGGITEDNNNTLMYDIVYDIISSLDLDT